MGLEVIGAGFGRTGTLSMKAALERLGYNRTHHMQEVAKSRTQIDLWHDVAEGLEPQWDDIFRGFAASVDFPSSIYYREIFEHFPDAKVVLTTRSVDSWYTSTAATIYPLTQLTPSWLLRVVPIARRMHETVNGTVWDGLFEGRFTDESFAKRIFLDHETDVCRHVPADRLLVFNVAEGWEPLCAFLGCDVPDEPFPHVNDKQSFQMRLRALKVMGVAPAATAAIGVVAVWRRLAKRF